MRKQEKKDCVLRFIRKKLITNVVFSDLSHASNVNSKGKSNILTIMKKHLKLK